tara:strand:- start:20 stop:154 length:135 start_codon:yes stop_codon:yes gene_type:complete
MKIIENTKSIGSVGKYNPIPPSSKSSKLKDNGVKKTMSKKTALR